MELFILFYAASISACAFIFVLPFYMVFIATSECIKSNLLAITESAMDNTNRERFLDQFIEFIELHSRVTQLSLLLIFIS